MAEISELMTQFRARDRRALSRLLSKVARGEELDAIREATAGARRGLVVAFTGSAGVGKSSLIGKSIELLRTRRTQVAVIACDPQSSLTGGALLGDRLRMSSGSATDDGVFIRSVAAAGGHQAIAENLDLMISLFFSYGFEVVLLETVGAGQGDTAVRNFADVLVVLLQPETGDELQWEKAGLLEVADIVVIHKSDLPGAARVESQVRSQLNLPGCREVPVLSAGSLKAAGLEELWHAIDKLRR